MSTSPFRSIFHGDEDIAAPNTFPLGVLLRLASSGSSPSSSSSSSPSQSSGSGSNRRPHFSFESDGETDPDPDACSKGSPLRVIRRVHRIPTGFWLSARGCRGCEATLGYGSAGPQPQRGCGLPRSHPSIRPRVPTMNTATTALRLFPHPRVVPDVHAPQPPQLTVRETQPHRPSSPAPPRGSSGSPR